MKLPDANVLIYAVDAGSKRHGAAREWLETTLSGTETIGFAWSVLHAFVRLTTSAQVFGAPLTADEALDYVDTWVAQPCTVILEPTERHPALLRELLADLGTAGNLTTDAHLAALAIEHGAELCSADADFSRFPGLRWMNPLAA